MIVPMGKRLTLYPQKLAVLPRSVWIGFGVAWEDQYVDVFILPCLRWRIWWSYAPLN